MINPECDDFRYELRWRAQIKIGSLVIWNGENLGIITDAVGNMHIPFFYSENTYAPSYDPTFGDRILVK